MGSGRQGDGSGSRVSRVCTEAVPAADRFDFWRSLFDPVQIDLPDPARADGFRGEYATCVGSDGVVLTDLRCEATLSVFPKDPAEHVLLSGLVAGDMAARDGGDRSALARPGRLQLMDPSGGELVSAGHWNIYLALPRAMASDFLGRCEPGVLDLAPTPLAGLLWSHMQGIAAHGDAMSEEEVAAAMQAATAMACVVLRQTARDLVSAPPADGNAATILAARQFISAHRHRPRLTADHVAQAVNCSRSHLYRIFASRGLSVADALRDSRLVHGRDLLNDGHEVGDVALACGYADASSFGKAFRRRFGLSPRDARALGAHARAEVG